MTVLSSELIQAADRYIDENHETFARLGDCFFDKFGYDKEKERISTQVRNLQQITCSATRFADIEDFVKNQMGKETANPPEWKAVGEDILAELKRLRDKSQELDSDSANQMALRLRLARGWGRAVVGEYLYRVAATKWEAWHDMG